MPSSDPLAPDAARLDVARREMSSLAFIATHDLQEPLRQILLCADGIADSDVDDGCQTFVTTIVHAAERMRSLVQAVHEYASITVDSNFVQPTDLAQICRSVQASVREAGGSFEMDVDLPLVDADPDQLERVFDELARNAVQFAHPDRKLEVTIRTELHDDHAVIRFTDNGVGIPVSSTNDVFGPFRSAHQDRAGIGVGLTLVRRIVEEHGGTVGIDTAEREGLCLSIRLPLTSDDFW